MTTKAEQERNLISLRRSKVAELLAKGYTNQSQIANVIHVSEPTISRDISFISEQSQRALRDLVDKRVPMRYLQCDVGLQAVLKKAWEIVDDPNSRKSEVISLLALISNLYDKLMELSTNGEVLSKGLSIIERTKAEILRREQQLRQLERRQSDTVDQEQETDTSQYKF